MMRDPIVVVGSGASGVHFAKTLLDLGRKVLMIDVGHPKPVPVMPAADLNGLKAGLERPEDYFLGRDFDSLILPGAEGEFYGFPPAKEFVFRTVDHFAHRASGFAPLFSFAAGGLAEAWTGGSYPFNDGELAAWPIRYADLEGAYRTVAETIGMNGTDDDMARFFPMHGGLQPPITLDHHAARLLATYENRRTALNDGLRWYMGRARLATITRDHDGRKACDRLGRCLWGCPSGSLWTPSVLLEELRAHPRFEHVPGLFVERFETSAEGRVTSLTTREVIGGAGRTFDVGTLVLAAGTLASAKITLDSRRRATGKIETLPGLMDNRQVLMPFVNLALVGRPWDARSYQYHQLAIGLDQGGPADYVHGLVTTLKTATIHPVVQNLPFGLGASIKFFRDIHGALGLVNINFSDDRRDRNGVTIEDGPDGRSRLVIDYAPSADEPERLARTAATFRKGLWKLGCLAPKGMTHVRPMGASVHYAGTFPMAESGGPQTTTVAGLSRDHENLVFADGSTFPSLPAKNLTFTLMANAVRIARLLNG